MFFATFVHILLFVERHVTVTAIVEYNDHTRFCIINGYNLVFHDRVFL